MYSAIRQDTWGDYTGRSLSIAFLCIPAFWLGTMVMVYPSIWLDWTPPLEYVPFFENPIANLQIMINPGFHPRHGCVGNMHENDTHHDAGGAERGLHQDCLVKGT